MVRLAEFIGMAVLAVVFARGLLTYFRTPTSKPDAAQPEKKDEEQ